MKVSGFTIARNVRKYNYPIIESINSILPICDEFIVNVGDSSDDTLDVVRSIKGDKIRIIQNAWNMDQKPDVLSHQTNLALNECKGDWAFYLQSDEVIHEDDLPKLKALMEKHKDDQSIGALKFRWMHFYGSYYRYRVDHGWFQKQDRIIRNDGTIESCKDAWGFKRKDDAPLEAIKTGCLLYHYGWVQPSEVMSQRRENAQKLWGEELSADEQRKDYDYGDLNRFPIYFGAHPKVMQSLIDDHELTQVDAHTIRSRHWWNPLLYIKLRYKTGRRVKEKL